MFEFFLWVYQCMCCASFGDEDCEDRDGMKSHKETQYTAFTQKCEKSGIYLAPGAVIHNASDASGSESSYEMCDNT